VRLSASPEETMRIAAELARHLRPGDVLFLEGDLAAGKTVFVRGLVGALGGEAAEVDSPTFVILQSYACVAPIRVVHHLDLYRLQDESLEGVGLEEVLAERDSITVVEWPDERVQMLMGGGQRLIRIRFSVESDGSRRIAGDVEGQGFPPGSQDIVC